MNSGQIGLLKHMDFQIIIVNGIAVDGLINDGAEKDILALREVEVLHEDRMFLLDFLMVLFHFQNVVGITDDPTIVILLNAE